MTKKYKTELNWEIDNRDMITTWLQLESGDYVEVNPWRLAENAISNLGLPKQKQVGLINMLHALERVTYEMSNK